MTPIEAYQKRKNLQVVECTLTEYIEKCEKTTRNTVIKKRGKTNEKKVQPMWQRV